MTATLAPVQTRPAAPEPLGRGSLLRAETHRFRSRRFLRLLVLLGAVGFAAALVLASTQFAQPSAAGLADAQARLDQVVAEGVRYHQECLTSGEIPSGTSPEAYCGSAPTAEAYGGPEQFIAKQPFLIGEDGLDGALAVAAATGAFAFLMGATWIGAEWSSRSLVALLFWEPRRLRVMAAKLTVLVGATALVGAAAQAVWAVAARVLSTTRGDGQVPPELWSTLAGTAGRGVLLTVLLGLLGFGLAHLLRGTAAALGVGFVHLAIVENAVTSVRPAWQEWLLTTNANALVKAGGGRYSVYEGFFDADGAYQFAYREHALSNLHGGVVLTVVTLTVVGLGVLLFTRRDLS